MSESSEHSKLHKVENGILFFLGANAIVIVGTTLLYAGVGQLGDMYDFVSPNHVLYTWIMYGAIGLAMGSIVSLLCSIVLLVIKKTKLSLHCIISFPVVTAMLLWFISRGW